MKAIMINIQPQWVEKIFNGEKTIEIRKTMPKCKLPCKVYIYCTKNEKKYFSNVKCCESLLIDSASLGKVVAEFTLNKIDFWQPYWIPDVLHICDMSELSCVPVEDIQNYSNGKRIYAWHIDDLQIYDKPKELSEFKKYCNLVHKEKNTQCFKQLCKNKDICSKELLTITRPPQSWCYVEEVEDDL